MLYSLSLSFLYQRDKEAVLLWIAWIILLDSLLHFTNAQASIFNHLVYFQSPCVFDMTWYVRHFQSHGIL